MISPLERAQAVVSEFASSQSSDDTKHLTDLIHTAIIEATNDELERRRQAERERDEERKLADRLAHVIALGLCEIDEEFREARAAYREARNA